MAHEKFIERIDEILIVMEKCAPIPRRKLVTNRDRECYNHGINDCIGIIRRIMKIENKGDSQCPTIPKETK